LSDPNQFFTAVLKGLRPLFHEQGFRPKGQNFVYETPECWSIVNFQKSRWSEQTEKTFYINLAVTAKQLLSFEGEPTDKAPIFWKCAWDTRAEHFSPEPKIGRWTVRDETSAGETLDYLRILLGNFAIPKVKELASESALLKMWADDSKLGYPQLKAKSALLASRGDIDDLERSLRTLRSVWGNGVVAEGVDDHIEKLRVAYPETLMRIKI
jgi:hypothetical protein